MASFQIMVTDTAGTLFLAATTTAATTPRSAAPPRPAAAARRSRRRSFFALAAVAAEATGERKLAQLVADHVFGNEHLDVRLAVVNHERVADELGNDRAPASPGGDRFLDAGIVLSLDLGVELRIDKRSLFE